MPHIVADQDSEAAQLLGTIRRGSENMSRLVNDLLNLAHVGRQEMKRERTALNAVVEEVITEMKRETVERDIEWRVADLPAAFAVKRRSIEHDGHRLFVADFIDRIA